MLCNRCGHDKVLHGDNKCGYAGCSCKEFRYPGDAEEYPTASLTLGETKIAVLRCAWCSASLTHFARYCHACGVAVKVKVLSESDEIEKQRRLYYQGIVYSVCNILDRYFTTKTVCGTADNPSTQVQDRLQHLAYNMRPVAHFTPDNICVLCNKPLSEHTGDDKLCPLS